MSYYAVRIELFVILEHTSFLGETKKYNIVRGTSEIVDECIFEAKSIMKKVISQMNHTSISEGFILKKLKA